MNHQPFEAWLLDEQRLTTDESRLLDQHLRTCGQCVAIAESGRMLKAARMAAPRDGFVARFRQQLTARRAAERRRRVWGALVLTSAALAYGGIRVAPWIRAFAESPGEWIGSWLSRLFVLFSSARAAWAAGDVVLRLTPSLVPARVWMMVASAGAAVALLWTVSIWRLARAPHGVRQ